MNITTIIPDDSIPAWQAVVDKFNVGSGEPTVTIEQFAQIFREEETAKYIKDYDSAQKTAMAENERLMALGIAVQARPDKLDEIEKAVQNILSK